MKSFGIGAVLFGALIHCGALAQKPTPIPPPPPPPGGALEAMSLIPKEAAKRLARIEARDGKPNPDRWYLLVHEPETPTGLREFVVAGSRIVAARQFSQFADALTEPDAFGDAFVRADSGYCARLGELYAAANGAKAVAFDFELARPKARENGASAVAAILPKFEATWPNWRLTVLDDKGDQIGVLVISAARGAVLAHDGFERVPDATQLPVPPTPPPASVTNPPKPPPPKKTPPKSSGKKGKN